MKIISSPTKPWLSCILLTALCIICTHAHGQWSLTGNSGTVPGTNFIGTTDSKAFYIKTKNSTRLMITGAGKVGIGTTAPVFKLDVKGGSINTDSVYRIGGNTVLSVNGSFNTFIGIISGISNTTGSSNTAAGIAALASNTTGFANTANGMYTLFSNTSGYENTGIGRRALYNNTTGIYNTAIGAEALYSNTTGSSNTAAGTRALYSDTTGVGNTAFGYEALYTNTSGSTNCAVGYNALRANTTGSGNLAVGNWALYNTATGVQNTAVGVSALNGTTNNMGNNTALGHGSGYGTSPIFGCTFIGKQANFTNGTSAINNSSGLGYSTFITASNQVQIGNSQITNIGGWVGWSNYSDSRIKRNIAANVPGLEFINRLKPVTYTLDLKAADEILNRTADDESDVYGINAAGRKAKEKIVYTGFLAQEVKAAANEISFDFSGVDAPKHEHDLYALRYAEFVVPLVKAVQELDKKNDLLYKKNEQLAIQNAELIKRIEALEQKNRIENKNQNIQTNDDGALLEQNSPNPFNTQTEIKFRLPSTFSSAQLIITDANGKQIRIVPIESGLKSYASVIIKASELAAGTYSYTLVIDGENVDTKQVILTK